MPRPQPKHIRSILPSLHLEHGAKADVFAERLQGILDVPRPEYGAHEKRCEETGHDERFPEEENTDHEDEEDDHAPYKAGKGQRPGLASRFVGLIEYWRRILAQGEAKRD